MDTQSRAVVVGASVAGLAAALAAAPRVDRVVVVERHDRPGEGEPTSIVPQGPFAHVLLPGGARALERLVPGFAGELRNAGAVGTDGERPCHWWAEGAVLRRLPDISVDAPMCSRELVESVLRARTVGHDRVEIRWSTTVRGLHVVDGRVVGVHLDGPGGPETLEADLVVDATGRSARGVAWLAELGYSAPPVEQVGVGLTYTNVEVERRPDDLDGADFAVVQNSATCARIGVALPTERGRWRIVLGGYFGDAAPLDRPGMLAWAGSLPDPAVRTLLDRPWCGDPRRHRFPASQRRRWARTRVPEGFCVLGDAVASFNPIYGQGMSSAALQAEQLAVLLTRHGLRPGLSRRFARAADRVADNPWRIAAGGDFVYAGTTGDRPRGIDLLNAYVARATRAAATDPVVNRALSRVRFLLAEPPALMSPAVALRVLRAGPAEGRRPAPLPGEGTVAVG